MPASGVRGGPSWKTSSIVRREEEGSGDSWLDSWMCLYLESPGWLRFILGLRPTVTGWGLEVQDTAASAPLPRRLCVCARACVCVGGV